MATVLLVMMAGGLQLVAARLLSCALRGLKAELELLIQMRRFEVLLNAIPVVVVSGERSILRSELRMSDSSRMAEPYKSRINYIIDAANKWSDVDS